MTLGQNSIIAQVQYVYDAKDGSQLAAGVTAGASTVTVVDPWEFNAEGGQILIGTDVYSYTVPEILAQDAPQADLSAPSPVAGEEDPIDEELDYAGVLNIFPNAVATYAIDTAVYEYPVTVERRALITEPGTGEDLVARVALPMVPMLAKGPRAQGLGENVLAEWRANRLVVTDLYAQDPVVDGSYIDPTTLPPVSSTDGLVPSSSPTAVVAGGPGFLAVTWTPITNADTVRYYVHISTTSGFTPSSGTLVGVVPDGSGFVIDALPSGAPLVVGTTYYVRIVAGDDDGMATTPGTQGSGTPILIDPAAVNLALGGGNQLTNSNAGQLVIAPYSANGSTLTAITAAAAGVQPFWGPNLFKMVANNTSSGMFLNGTNGIVPAYPGDKWTASAWGLQGGVHVTQTGFRVELRWYDAAGTLLGSVNGPFSTFASGVWNRATVSGTAPASTAKVGILLRADTATVGDVYYATALQLEMGNVASAYAPKVDEIVDGTIATTMIQDNAITTPKLIANAVTAAKIAAHTITANEIQASTITATEIASHTITAAQIFGGTITATEIAASTIDATRMNVSQLSAITANMGTLTAGEYKTGAGVTWAGNTGGIIISSVGDGSGNYGMRAFDGSGGTYELQGSTGAITVGALASDTTRQRVVINRGGLALFGMGTVPAQSPPAGADLTWSTLQVADIGAYQPIVTGVTATSTTPTITAKTGAGSAAVTTTFAAGTVATATAHGAVPQDPVYFTTTGTLPSPLVAGTTYYMRAITDLNTFGLSATVGGAAITFAGAGTGVHTLRRSHGLFAGDVVEIRGAAMTGGSAYAPNGFWTVGTVTQDATSARFTIGTTPTTGTTYTAATGGVYKVSPRGMMSSNTDTSGARMWLDSQGLHSQILVSGLNQNAPWRTFDANPADALGFRFHTATTKDALRIDPVNGATFKLATAADPNSDLAARWTRQTDGSVAAKLWGDNLGDDTLHGQMNVFGYGKTGGVGEAILQGQVGTSTSPTSYAAVRSIANFAGTSSFLQAIAGQGASTITRTIIRQDGLSSFGQLDTLQTWTAHQFIAPATDVVALTVTRGTDTSPTANIQTWMNAAQNSTLAFIGKGGRGAFGQGGINTLVNAGAVTDASHPFSDAVSGSIAIDTTNKRLYTRIGSTWFVTGIGTIPATAFSLPAYTGNRAPAAPATITLAETARALFSLVDDLKTANVIP